MATFYSFCHDDTAQARVYCRNRINFTSLMFVKEDLKVNGELDPVLRANLDHAVVTLSQVHPSCLHKATLLIAGDSLLVKIHPGFTSDSKMNFLVTTVDGRPQLHQEIICEQQISLCDIHESHFLGHRCQDQQQSCLQQAIEAVRQSKTAKQLRIVCNKWFLTYTVANDENTIDPDADIITVETQCRLKLSIKGFGGLLEAKCWLEKEKPEKRGLAACLDYLVKKYIAKEQEIYYNFILKDEGEMAFINTGCFANCFLYYNSEGVSMCPSW